MKRIHFDVEEDGFLRRILGVLGHTYSSGHGFD